MRAFSIFLAFFLVSVHGFASEAAPAEKLNRVVLGSLDVVYGPASEQTSPDEKQVQVREMIESEYDMTVLIRRAIGRNWNLMSEGEQEQVLELVKRLVVKAFVNGLDGSERPEVTFEETIVVSSKRLEIPAVVVLDGKPISVVYRMGLMKSGWQLYDIVAEDISVVSNFRQQFDDHFRKSNGAELVEKLEELLEKEVIDGTVKL